MKKSFLLIALFALMFLGLGNYTFGQTDIETKCEAARVICYGDCNVNKDPSLTDPIKMNLCKTNCDDAKKTCLLQPVFPPELPADEENPIENQGGNTSQDQGCPNLKGGVIRSIGLGCVCPDGTKNVDGVCTSCSAKGVCCGIELNTSVPFIGKCIESEKTNRGAGETNVTGETAFPVLMGSMTKILVTAILIVSFVLILIGGIMIATGNPEGGKKMIIKVVIGIALLGASGVILRLINPNFFG